ncbi:hypothetical protein DM02DRAFT_179110 [Periconia macrospinosa]|uniref:Uncharacterized protein n=1 Tax=Periconia macrospinosa TaxID=97972 RepID=A0A2V1E2F5_9PLEO|nr:hypothetical protein DM02DRAFT_179110 [Periconia macrospinosa]
MDRHNASSPQDIHNPRRRHRRRIQTMSRTVQYSTVQYSTACRDASMFLNRILARTMSEELSSARDGQMGFNSPRDANSMASANVNPLLLLPPQRPVLTIPTSAPRSSPAIGPSLPLCRSAQKPVGSRSPLPRPDRPTHARTLASSSPTAASSHSTFSSEIHIPPYLVLNQSHRTPSVLACLLACICICIFTTPSIA